MPMGMCAFDRFMLFCLSMTWHFYSRYEGGDGYGKDAITQHLNPPCSFFFLHNSDLSQAKPPCRQDE
jgi:hypothetical protein